jgi:hypothetical protein
MPAPDGGYPGNNTAEGQDALFSLTTGLDNTANGFQALFNNTFGSANTATGSSALHSNTTGNDNTATGRLALTSNTTGGLNTATGDSALFFNTTGNNNTATGDFALGFNTTGNNNTATGGDALGSNTTGSNNTATGDLALGFNTTGGGNTATGDTALFFNETGSNNTATGVGALYGCSGGECGPSTGNNNTATGAFALLGNVTGSQNTALGVAAGLDQTTGSNNIYIGDTGVPGESNVIAIGNIASTGTAYEQFYVGAVFGVTTVSGTTLPVIVSDEGQLGTAPSAARFKKEIKPMDNVSESVLALKPVTFHYKSDKTNTPQFGLVAEEVAKVNPDLVVRDKNGEIYSVRYEAVNAMLLNEFLKEHQKVEQQDRKLKEQEVTIAQLKKDLQATGTQQQRQIEALTASLQKVSAQLEVSKAAPQTVLNDQ